MRGTGLSFISQFYVDPTTTLFLVRRRESLCQSLCWYAGIVRTASSVHMPHFKLKLLA